MMNNNRKPQWNSVIRPITSTNHKQFHSVNKNIHLYKNDYPFIFLERETLKNVSVKEGKGSERLRVKFVCSISC